MNAAEFKNGGRRRQNSEGTSLVSFVQALQNEGCENIRFSHGKTSEAGRLSVWLTWEEQEEEFENHLICSERTTPAALAAVEAGKLGDFLRTLLVFRTDKGFFLGRGSVGEAF
jgi:hypothetical protein